MAIWQHPWTDVPALDATGWIALIGGLTVLGTVVAFGCYFGAINSIGPSRTSMLASVEVVSATAFAALWLGTSFTPMDLLGLVFVMSTVFLLAKKGNRSTSALPSDAPGNAPASVSPSSALPSDSSPEQHSD